MKVLLYSNKNIDANYEKTKTFLSYLLDKNVEVVVPKEDLDSFLDFNVLPFDEETSNTIDILIVLGGDGTFLSAANEYYKYNIPYLGLNIGRVGYLTEGNMDGSYKIIDKVLNNRYKVESRPLLSVKVISEKGYNQMIAFNEVMVHRGQYMKMLKIDMKVKEQFMDAFYADGVLVSTSMGSSAYNLSAGGPLLLENVNCFVITAICSQSGIMPSVVFNADDHVEISAFTKEEGKYVVVVDGREQIEVTNGTKIFVKKSSETLNIVSTEIENKSINHITKAFNGYIKYY